MPSWASIDFARRHWEDCPSDEVAQELLDAAMAACVAFAPALPDDYDVKLWTLTTSTGTTDAPVHYQLGNVHQARELNNAILRGDADMIGDGEYALRRRPLTAAVKQLLRPQQGLPGVG